MEGENKPDCQQREDIREVLHLVPLGAFQTDTEGNCFFVNDEWSAVSGLSYGQSLGKGWLEAFSDGDRPALTASFESALKEQKPAVMFRSRINHPLHGIRYCRIHAKFIFNEDGRPRCIMGFVQDVTEETNVLEQVAIQNELFQILRNIQDQFYLSGNPRELFTTLLNSILTITGCRYGYIAEVSLREQMPLRNMRILAASGLPASENEPARASGTGNDRYLQATRKYLEQVLATGKVYTYHAPGGREERQGEAHPGSFAGLPALVDNQLVGVIGLADRGNGFDGSIIEFLEPLATSLANLIVFNRLNEKKIAAENQQKELTYRLETLITSMDDIVLELDGSSMRFLNAWTKSEETLFMPRSAFLGKTVMEAFGEHGLQFITQVNEALASGSEGEFEYRHIDPSVNKWYRAKVALIRKEDSKEKRIAMSIRDITRQKEYERAASEAKEKLERTNQLLDVSQELSQTGGWEYNHETGEIFWTKQMHLMYGLPMDFVPTRENILKFYDGEMTGFLEEEATAAILAGKPFDIEFRATNGKWLRAIGVPIVRDGQVVRVRGALSDITAKRKNEEELIKAKNLAEEAAQAKTNFLSVMSHEIRTPLNGIIGIANLLRYNQGRELEENVNNLVFSANHLLQLVNDILDLSKIENDKLKLIAAEVNVIQLAESICNQFRQLAESKSIRLNCEIDRCIPLKVMADPVRLNQVLNNLIENALKFTEEGAVTLTLRMSDLKEDAVTIHFSVKDTGVGIPEELHRAIFDNFTQVQQATHRKHAGTGLGLAITRRLIELHGSEIFVKSSLGEGTEFYFDIRFALPREEKSAISPKTLLPDLSDYRNKFKGVRLLLVEDNRINALVAKKQLEFFGIFPDCANNGKEALKLLDNNDYDIALIDLHMPEMDGYEFSACVQVQHPDVHIVIFTADIMNEVRLRLGKMNIHDILHKPFVPEEMLNVLLRIAEKKEWNIE